MRDVEELKKLYNQYKVNRDLVNDVKTLMRCTESQLVERVKQLVKEKKDLRIKLDGPD
jgi:hypothetical protein